MMSNNNSFTLDDYSKIVHKNNRSKIQDLFEDDYDIGLSVNIINARRSLGITQSALAKALGTKQPNVARFESGVTPPSHEMIKKIARTLGLRPTPPCFTEYKLATGVTTVPFSISQPTAFINIKNLSDIPQYAYSN
jgi:transcriptional regulator with XRE-family HTH domain